MFQALKSALNDTLTGKDNESIMWAKLWGTIILVFWLIISLIAVVAYQVHVDLNSWGGVTTSIYGVVNAAIRVTHNTEPDK